ncbi:MAG: ribbon-helix-helix protein, CopG family [Bdellovibrionota bacterium]
MPRPRKAPGEKAVAFTVTVEPEEFKKIQRFMRADRITRSEVIRRAIAALDSLTPAQRLEIINRLNETQKKALTSHVNQSYKNNRNDDPPEPSLPENAEAAETSGEYRAAGAAKGPKDHKG